MKSFLYLSWLIALFSNMVIAREMVDWRQQDSERDSALSDWLFVSEPKDDWVKVEHSIADDENLFDAIRTGAEEVVTSILLRGVSRNLTNKAGNSPLYVAVQEDKHSLIPLLASYFDVNAYSGGRGLTPLMLAAKKGDEFAVRILVQAAGAKVAGHWGSAAVRLAKENQHPQVAALLRQLGAPEPEQEKARMNMLTQFLMRRLLQ